MSLDAIQDWRFERKFLLEDQDNLRVEHVILSNPAFFRRLHADRKVNNVYFDTEDFSCFFENIDGEFARTKFRIRWYGDTFRRIEKPVLEAKIKKGLVGAKRRYELASLELTPDSDLKVFMKSIHCSNLDENVTRFLKNMRPTLLNSYMRKYYISCDRKYRLTLDSNLQYFELRPDGTIYHRVNETDDLVVEIKYDDEGDGDCIQRITNCFPFRMTKSSKYVCGIKTTQLAVSDRYLHR